MEDGDFKNADKYLEKVLDENPECGEAYLGKLMKELKVRKPEDLKKCKKPFNDRNSFQKIMKFGDYNLKRTMDEYIECIKRNSESPTVQFGANEQGNKKTKKTKGTNKFVVIFVGVLSVILVLAGVVGYKLISGKNKENQEIKDNNIVAGEEQEIKNNKIVEWENLEIKSNKISAGYDHTVALNEDGTVVAVGDDDYEQCNVSKWADIVSVSVGDYHTVGLKKDGTVVAVGRNDDGQCETVDWKLF